MKACRRSRVVAPLVLNLSARRRWVVNLTPRSLYRLERIPLPVNRRQVRPQRRSGCFGEEIKNTGLFEMIVGMIRCYSPSHLFLQMQPHLIYFCGVTSRIRFMFLLFPQVSWNWRYKSEPPLKPSPLTCYIQFGTNSIIVLMFVESQRVLI